MPELYEELRDRLNSQDRNRENRARLAQVFGGMSSAGQGTFILKKAISFGLTFIEEPFMSHGCRIDIDAWEDLIDHAVDLDDDPPLPSVTGFVTEWVQDDRDFYVGAHVAVSVWFPVIDPTATEPFVPIDSQPAIEHYFTFTGVAMKDVEPDLRD